MVRPNHQIGRFFRTHSEDNDDREEKAPDEDPFLPLGELQRFGLVRLIEGLVFRMHDAYPVRCRVPSYYEPCSERVRVCLHKKFRQLEK